MNKWQAAMRVGRVTPHCYNTFHSHINQNYKARSYTTNQGSPKRAPETTIQCNKHSPDPSYFRRELPKHLVAFSSPEGRQLFKEAIADNNMNSYFHLADQYQTQQEPAYCGLTSLTMCLNALGIDPKRKWKGPWRYFTEELLDCCTPISIVQQRGITFNEFVCLAKCNGASVQSVRINENTTEEAFRNEIIAATSSDNLEHIVVSYSRAVLGQTGSGHFSPIGGYHPASDMVLVLDTARFKYNAHWVPLPLLFTAMCQPDKSTNLPRGYFILRRDPLTPSVNPSSEAAECLSTTTSAIVTSLWPDIGKSVFRAASRIPESTDTKLDDLNEFIRGVFSHLNWQEMEEFEKSITNSYAPYGVTKGAIQQTKMFSLVRENWPESAPSHLQVFMSLIFLACPGQLYSSLSDVSRELLGQYRNLDLFWAPMSTVIMQIREEMFLITKTCVQCHTVAHKL